MIHDWFLSACYIISCQQRFTKKHSDKDDEVSNSESKNNPSLDCESAQSSSRGKPGYAIWDTGALVTQDSDDDSYNQKLGKYEKILTAAELVARSLNNIACVYVEVGKLEGKRICFSSFTKKCWYECFRLTSKLPVHCGWLHLCSCLRNSRRGEGIDTSNHEENEAKVQKISRNVTRYNPHSANSVCDEHRIFATSTRELCGSRQYLSVYFWFSSFIVSIYHHIQIE